MGSQLLIFDIAKMDQPINHVIARQGDGLQKSIDVQILAKSQPYDFTTVAQIGFKGIKPDGKMVIDFENAKITDARNGVFTYRFPSECFTAAGQYKDAFFVLEGYDGTIDTTIQFYIEIITNSVDHVMASDDYVSPLKKS
ncbi:BppU family phage baseplate upper protein [Enterococcus faecium]